MKKWVPILLLFFTNLVFAQNEFLEYSFDYIKDNHVVLEHENTIVLEKTNVGIIGDLPFINVVVEIDQPENPEMLENIWIRNSIDGIHWSVYQQVHKYSHADDIYEDTKSELLYFNKNVRWLQVKVVNDNQDKLKFSKLQLNISAPSNDRIVSNSTNGDYRDDCEMPDMLSRSEWCSSGECPIGNGVETDVTHLIVHHSAGTSESSNWGAVVRAIWHFHVDDRGWDDIGYNWLIDGNGVLYQGRLDNIRGAHMCGKNTGTMGVCVLGNFQNFEATNAAKLTLSKLLAWKSEQKELDPLATTLHASSGKNLKTIVGHKDGCPPGYTQCPGDNFYPKLVEIRSKVDSILTSCLTMSVRERKDLDVSFIYNNDQKTILIDGDFKDLGFSVFNLYGQKLKHMNRINGKSLDVKNFLAGTYFIQFYNETSSKTYKFIVI